MLHQGTIVNATLIAAPPSTKKDSNDYFGLKAHAGVDADSGLVHSLEISTAKIADGSMIDALLHGGETVVLGDDRHIPAMIVTWKRKNNQVSPSELLQLIPKDPSLYSQQQMGLFRDPS